MINLPNEFLAELNSIRDRCPKVWDAFKKQEDGALEKADYDNVVCALCNVGRLGLARQLLDSLPVGKVKKYAARNRVFDDYAMDVPEKRKHLSCIAMGCSEAQIRKCFGEDLRLSPDKFSQEFKVRLNWKELAEIGLFFESKKDSEKMEFVRGRFNAELFTKYLLGGVKIAYSDNLERYYLYQYGSWHMLAQKTLLIKRLIHNQFDRIYPNIWAPGLQKACLDAVEVLCTQTSSLSSAECYINVKNGLIDLLAKERYKQIRHTSEIFSTSQIPVDLDRGAQCPKFKQTLNDFFISDREMVELTRQLMGYCLGPSTKAGKMFILRGASSTGKSLFAEILSDIVGRDNVSNQEFKKFSGQFGPYQIVDKNLNVSTEADNSGRFAIDVENIKKIVTGDTIMVEGKGKNGYSYKPHVKLMVATNFFPKVADISEAFRRRLIMLEFEQRFTDDPHEGEMKRNVNLYEELQTELEGIFVFALGGLYDLMDANYVFPHAAKSEACLKQYAKELDCFLRFVDEMLEPDPAGKINTTYLRELFERWCEGEGIKDYQDISAQKFWKKIQPVLENERRKNGVYYNKDHFNGGRVHLMGYRLKDDALDVAEYAFGGKDEISSDLGFDLDLPGIPEDIAAALRNSAKNAVEPLDGPEPLDGEKEGSENAEVAADSKASKASQKATRHDEESEPQAPAKKPKKGPQTGKKHPKSRD